MALGLAPSYLGLCVAQAALVAFPFGIRRRRRLGRIGIVLPALALLAGVGLIRGLSVGPRLLALLATFAAPVVTGVAAWLVGRRRRWLLVSFVVCLYLLAWRVSSLSGEAAGVALIGIACVALAAVVASVAPASSIELGLVLLALVDVILVWGTRQVGPATAALDRTRLPVVLGRQLPALQEARFGSALMGWLDLFAPALLGATLLREERVRAAAVMLVVGAAWGLLLAVTSPIPATVPVVVVLLVLRLSRRHPRCARGGGGLKGWLLATRRTLSSRRTRTCLRVPVCAIAGVAMLAAAVPAALADGDPASDVLFQRKLFVPYGWRDGAAGTSRLAALLEQAAAAGRPIRVAIIAAPQDLGSVPSLFGRPVEYARFLGAELQFVYHGRLLVVMPDGLGVSERGQPLVRAQQVLGDIRVRPNADGLVQSAVDATRTLLGETAARRRSRHARRLAPSSGRRTRDSTSTLTGNVAKGDLVHVRKFEAIVALALLTVLFVGAAAALTASQRRRAAAMVERR